MRYASLSRGVKQLVAMAVLLGVTTETAAQDTANLRGNLYIAGKTPVDPPPNEPKKTHAYMTIEGAAALQMYRAMKAAEHDDVCLADGWRSKSAGSLQCSISANHKDARCNFSVDLVSGRLAPGGAC
jgi:hypothetical protein